MVHIIVLPSLASSFRRVMHELHDAESRPLVGSSKNITGGLLTSSKAMASLFLWPPDIILARVLPHLPEDKVSKLTTFLATRLTLLVLEFPRSPLQQDPFLPAAFFLQVLNLLQRSWIPALLDAETQNIVHDAEKSIHIKKW